MRRTALVLALMMIGPAFVAGIGQAAYHQDEAKGNQNKTGQQNQTGDENKTRDQNRTRGGGPPASAQERRDAARDNARRAGLFAQFNYQDGAADGRFVSFNLSEDTASVTDYALTNNGTSTAVFSEIAPDAFSGTSPARAAGSQLMLKGDSLHLQAHDNPTGLVRYTSTNGSASVTFTLADDATAGDVKNDTRVKIDAGDVSGTILLAGNGTLSADNGTVTADLTDEGTVLFRAVPLGGSPQEAKQARALDNAMADGKLGASMRVAGVNGTAATDSLELGVNASAREATDGRARVEVSANRSQGKIVNLAFDKGTINASTPEEAVVKFDGENISVDSEIDTVVNATGDEARAHVLVTNSTVEVTVYVPSFSVHSLVTKTTSSDLPDLPTPPAVQNPSGAAMSTAEQARQQVQQRAQTWDQLPSQVRQQAAQQAQQARLFGAFELSAGGQAAGAFVSAGVDANAGQLTDVQVTDAGSQVPVFDAVDIDPFTSAASPQNAGATVGMVGQEATALVHDTPTGALDVKAGSSSVTITYQLADGISTQRVDDKHVKLSGSAAHGHLLLAGGNGEFSLEGDQIRLALGANGQALFLLDPSQATAAATALHERVDALKAGGFGAAHSVVGASGQAVDAAQSYSVETRTKALETGQRVTTTVSSQAPEPRIVSIDVPLETVGASAASDVEVTLDGETVDAGASASQVLQGTSSQAQASVTAEGNALHVLVNVPAFSDHDVTVQSTDDSTDGGDGTTDDTNDTGGTGGTDDGQQDAPGVGAFALVGVMALAAALIAVRRES